MQYKYEANWDSLNSAPVPAWFNEAKLGLYIFWGPYSVPSFHPGKGYAEWFGMNDYASGFMEKNYGKDFIYEDFADLWKGELWDPEKWADLFVESGARYIIIVAKYHDGFCLFPTQYDNRTIRRDKWNSIDRGPGRDILGELSAACEKRGLKVGIYMSLYEWWHPLWINSEERERYVAEVLHPQFKELVTRYKPWFVFMDGDWEGDTNTFKSAELVKWLLNESPVREYVAFNDRWGQSRAVNGMIYNTEFGGGNGFKGHAWQEDRSLCPSYGYNRNLDITQYDSPEQLIAMVAKTASNGGNLILGVGPTADGRIPLIYQERLLQLGKWLKTNGEAIYGTERWVASDQGDEIRFTRRADAVYAISLRWPGKEIVLKGVEPGKSTVVTLLGHEKPLEWKYKADGLHIEVPQLTIDQLPCLYAWTFKISNPVIPDVRKPCDIIYNAGDFGLIEGDWDTWPACYEDIDIPKHNAAVIQNLLDKAGQGGGGTVVLPEGTYCLSGSASKTGSCCLTIKYDNIILTGQGRDENGKYKTRLKTNYRWDAANGIYRSSGICIRGEPYGSDKARQNIELSHFEMDGGRGWSGHYDWGFDPETDYGWDIMHQGIAVARDEQVTHVILDDLYIHRYSGETLYVGGLLVGYLTVKNCILADTNASCFNLYAAYLDVYNNIFGTPETRCRFWIEYCARASDIVYTMPPVPEGLEKDNARFHNNKFYNATGSHGIAIAQGNCTTYALSFENNTFDNSLSASGYGLFQFAGSVYGPVYIKNNLVQNFPGPMIIFDYGGGTVPVDHLMNKNIYFEGNRCINVGGPFISLEGTWGKWDAELNKPVPVVQPVEKLVVRDNYFEGSSINSKSVAISNSWDMIESAVDLKSVEITGNTFKNCTTPEELRVFSGNLPLFSGNRYIDVKNTNFGGISVISPDAPQIRSVFEYLTVNACTTVAATLRTGKNEDGQQVIITGGADTAAVIFSPDIAEAGIVVPFRLELGPGDRITFRYDAGREKWIFVSFHSKSQAAGAEAGLIPV